MICKKILVVDDESGIREVISDLLKMDGYFVAQAKNGQEALDYLRSLAPENFPGMIMLDLMMPVMDGVAFLHEVKENHKEFSNIPIVVVSAFHSIDQSYLNHAVERLSKPLDIDELYRVIERYCGDSPQSAL